MEASLRQRLRTCKISCQPWRIYRGEIREFCISAKCLFANSGVPHDVLEIELIAEGWLQADEKLMDILRTDINLRRPWLPEIATDYGGDYGAIPDDFTEEDYLAHSF